MSERICSFDGCEKALFARGWCSLHYQRWRNHGDPLTKIQHRNVCSIEGCDEFVASRGWCVKHYTRWKTHGDPMMVLPRGHRTQRPVVDGQRECSVCNVVQPITEFHRNSANPSGFNTMCKKCKAEKAKAWYDLDPARAIERQTWRTMKHRYGITQAEYEQRLAEQGGRCAICRQEQPGRRLAVDHDHACCPGEKSCGQCLRALLCLPCNFLLGFANDDPDRLLAAVAYLRRWVPRPSPPCCTER